MYKNKGNTKGSESGKRYGGDDKRRGERSDRLSDRQVEEIRQTFELFDKNGDGCIDAWEIKDVVHSLGQCMSEGDIDLLVKNVDKDGNGTVDFEEFLHHFAPRYRTKDQVEAEMMEAFRAFDKNGDGFISAHELRVALTSVGECLTDAQVDEVLRDADKDGDGQISYEEFSKYLLCGM
ncbi:hypothetical protein SNE40_021778 [Patella caerulea]|uniref:EF-hand domain-containing protein n=1 Tax=Patella caerulea TaxID=87958 RepID=A0AAN8J4C9_PATCE